MLAMFYFIIFLHFQYHDDTNVVGKIIPLKLNDLHFLLIFITNIQFSQNADILFSVYFRLHQSDAVAVHELCTEVLKNDIIFYKELIQ